ncbi:conserved hypothetical protein [Deferribacter desulfuricans SSM1]|uniref:PAS domain-containing protein n=1 Tax=Deferribacter desulfuricans (strain DSM 14783 / JCM 11476 / NBRC 101012 / SSM1) TaxID=639282 RepID=D3P9Z2_DEFDS|nr:PAS sensor domain-containing protein [Deferribacter desulfuricans]BAI81532.1 conserved hypothetical protein [Deferribacter desulfuricans SSM1]
MDEKTIIKFVENAADAILAIDKEGIIRFWNSGASDLFRFSKEEAINSSLDIIIPEKLRQRHWEAFFNFVKTGRGKYSNEHLLSVPAITKNNKKIFVDFKLTTLTDNKGNIEYCFAIMRKKEKNKDL